MEECTAIELGPPKNIILASWKRDLGGTVCVVYGGDGLVGLPLVAEKFSVLFEFLKHACMCSLMQSCTYMIKPLSKVEHVFFIVWQIITSQITWRDKVAMQTEEAKTHGGIVNILSWAGS